MVVSGRPLRDLQELLPVPGLDFLGSHGGEAFIGGRLHPLPVAAVDDARTFPMAKPAGVEASAFSGVVD